MPSKRRFIRLHRLVASRSVLYAPVFLEPKGDRLWYSGESSCGSLTLHMWRPDWRPKCDNWLSSFGFQLQCLHIVITIDFHWIGLRILNLLSQVGLYCAAHHCTFYILHSISPKAWLVTFWFSLHDSVSYRCSLGASLSLIYSTSIQAMHPTY